MNLVASAFCNSGVQVQFYYIIKLKCHALYDFVEAILYFLHLVFCKFFVTNRCFMQKLHSLLVAVPEVREGSVLFGAESFVF
jgi:hypothetical protein